MGNSLRCCIACVLPCGALDLIRVVHLDGQIEEITRSITAAEFLESHPDHFLSLSSGSHQGGTVVRQILVLSSRSELKRGSIYFLIPCSSLPQDLNKKSTTKKMMSGSNIRSSSGCTQIGQSRSSSKIGNVDQKSPETELQKRCSSGRDRRRHSRTASWLPHLESIVED